MSRDLAVPAPASLHRQPRPATGLALALVLALGGVVGCASSPPAPQTPALPESNRICGPQARFVFFTDLGVPREAEVRDLALDAEHAWILFDDRRLVRVSRAPGPAEVAVIVANDTVDWTTIDGDPTGGVWVGTQPIGLRRVEPDMAVRAIELGGVTGEGRFSHLAATADAIYAVPAQAEYAVWIFDREGALLALVAKGATDTEADEPVDLQAVPGGWGGYLIEDEGNVFLRSADDVLRRLSPQGVVEEITDSPLLVEAGNDSRSVTGTDVGREGETWFFGGSRRLVRLGGELVALGTFAHRVGTAGNTILYLPDEQGELQPHLERCGGRFLRDLVGDEAGYAAISLDGLVTGG